MRGLSLLALAAPLVSAIQFTSPAANSTLSKGDKVELSWDTVDTDPSAFSIYLVNFVNWPPFYTPLAYDVETAAGVTEVTVPCGVDTSYGFQFNAINGTNVYVIYAQTEKFYIDGGPCEDPTPSASTCAPAATVTVTVSTTLSKGGYGNATYPATTLSSTAAPSYTSPGKCPDTVGWGESGYSYPVKLTSVPHADYDTDVSPAPTKAPEVHYPAVESPKYGFTSTIYSTVQVYMDLEELAKEDCYCK